MKKVGIYAPWASGDTIISSSVLKYKDIIWKDCYLVWFYVPSENPYAMQLHRTDKDMMFNNPWISELRPSMDDPLSIINLRIGGRQRSFGPPWMQLSVDKTQAGLLSPEKTHFESVKDLDLCFFPAPWANCDHLDVHFSLISNFVFNFPANLEIHPCLFFTPEEDQKAEQFIKNLPFKYSIMMETKYFSGQSNWDDQTTETVINTCRSRLGDCNFIFASPNTHHLFSGKGVVDCSQFTIRQCIPIFNRCNLFLGVSSGISQAICSWTANPLVKRIELINTLTISTSPIARGHLRTAFSQSQITEHLHAVLLEIKQNGINI